VKPYDFSACLLAVKPYDFFANAVRQGNVNCKDVLFKYVRH
jgi:hypothetical protein